MTTSETGSMPVAVGIPHPSIFTLQEKRLRFLFLSSYHFLDLLQDVQSLTGVDVFPVRGHHDLLIVHLDSSEYSLRYQLAGVYSYEKEDAFWFEVDRYFKFAGTPIDSSLPELPDIDLNTASKVVAATMNLAALAEADRNSLVRRRLLLTSGRPDSDIEERCLRRSLILIHLQIETAATRRRFEERVLPQISGEDSVQSVMAGRSIGGGVSFSYLLDVLASPYETDRLGLDIQIKSRDRDIEASTRTVDLEAAIKHSLWQSLLYPPISEKDAGVLEWLLKPNEDGRAANFIPPPLFERLIVQWARSNPFFQRIRVSLSRLRDGGTDRLKKICNEMRRTMLRGEMDAYAAPIQHFVDYTSEMLQRHSRAIAATVTTRRSTAGPVFHAYCETARLSEEQKRSLLSLNEIRTWYAHPEDNIANLQALTEQVVHQRFCEVLDIFSRRAKDLGWA